VIEWLSGHEGVHDISLDGVKVQFGYKGDDEGQAELMADMIRDGLRLRAFEERGSSFEDILIEVAENNRKS